MEHKNCARVFFGVSLLAVLLSVLFSVFVSGFSDSATFVSSQNIKWVDFKPTYQAMADALSYDIETYGTDAHLTLTEILACLAAKGDGTFQTYKKSDLLALCDKRKMGETIETLTKNLKSYAYYKEAYDAVLGGFVGEFETEKEDGTYEKRYGLKVFSPIARGYAYSHSDDFGVSRTYGFKRKHLGHDLMGSVGTPIIAVESGVVENVGWNRYGGWRIGIRSFDKKRYYYYAHLKKDHPYNDIYEGKTVMAGEVIGYLGMTGYSTKENVNNIKTPHLHFGMELIFDEKRREAGNEIWIDVYAITRLLEKNKSQVKKEGNEFYRKYEYFDPSHEVFFSPKTQKN